MLDKRIKIEYESKEKKAKLEAEENIQDKKIVSNNVVPGSIAKQRLNEAADAYDEYYEQKIEEEERARIQEEKEERMRMEAKEQRRMAVDQALAEEAALRDAQIQDDIADLFLAAYLLD